MLLRGLRVSRKSCPTSLGAGRPLPGASCAGESRPDCSSVHLLEGTMPRKIAVLMGLAVAVLLSGVVVFHLGHELSWLDALYFTVTTMTTVGYGDINLKD